MKILKKGFTLAEVLITLAVIGVIASVTLPNLKADIDKNVMAQSLRTNVSVLKSAFEQMKAKENVDDIRDTVLWSDLVSEEVNADSDEDVKDQIKDQFGKYFKIEKITSGVPENITINTLQIEADDTMDKYIRFYMPNSATYNLIFYPASYTPNCDKEFCNPVADLILDVNGDKGPNIYGKDIYRFYIGETGDLYPYGGEAVNEYKSDINLWSDSSECVGKSPKGNGFSCTARVMEEGYSINYK